MNEWDWIAELHRAVPPSAPGIATGIGDDAAVLDDAVGKLLVSTDSFVEGVHFRPEWTSWERIGRKMAEAAISDIAAMGGEPTAMVVGLSAAREVASAAAPGLLAGFLAAQVPLVGGDTTSAREGSLTVTVTVLGRAERPVLRSGARPGDGLYVSGVLGGAAAGLASLVSGLGRTACERRFLEPRARRDLAASWGATASALIDISDGLAAECGHLASCSGVRLVIDRDRVPLSPDVIDLPDAVLLALGSGEEFELLGTSPVPLHGGTLIGRVEAGAGVYDEAGVPIEPRGWTHWA